MSGGLFYPVSLKESVLAELLKCGVFSSPSFRYEGFDEL